MAWFKALLISSLAVAASAQTDTYGVPTSNAFNGFSSGGNIPITSGNQGNPFTGRTGSTGFSSSSNNFGGSTSGSAQSFSKTSFEQPDFGVSSNNGFSSGSSGFSSGSSGFGGSQSSNNFGSSSGSSFRGNSGSTETLVDHPATLVPTLDPLAALSAPTLDHLELIRELSTAEEVLPVASTLEAPTTLEAATTLVDLPAAALEVTEVLQVDSTLDQATKEGVAMLVALTLAKANVVLMASFV